MRLCVSFGLNFEIKLTLSIVPFLLRLITVALEGLLPRADFRPMSGVETEGAQSDLPRVGRNQRAKK